MTDESWYVVRNTPGVTGFVGSAGAGSKPNPLPDEVRFILKQMGLKENNRYRIRDWRASAYQISPFLIKLEKFKRLKQINLN